MQLHSLFIPVLSSRILAENAGDYNSDKFFVRWQSHTEWSTFCTISPRQSYVHCGPSRYIRTFDVISEVSCVSPQVRWTFKNIALNPNFWLHIRTTSFFFINYEILVYIPLCIGLNMVPLFSFAQLISLPESDCSLWMLRHHYCNVETIICPTVKPSKFVGKKMSCFGYNKY